MPAAGSVASCMTTVKGCGSVSQENGSDAGATFERSNMPKTEKQQYEGEHDCACCIDGLCDCCAGDHSCKNCRYTSYMEPL